MRKLSLLCLVGIWTLNIGLVPARAEMCTLDNVSAATVLLPYFEVDVGEGTGADGSGKNTVLSLHNASSEAVLTRVTVWTDWAVPVLNFNVFLTGYDVVTMDLLDMIVNGNIPITADAQSDSLDEVSPHGNNSEWDDSFESCGNFFPFFVNPLIQGFSRDLLQNSLSGYPVEAMGGGCMGEGLNGVGACANGECPPGTVARGYITIDSVNRCDLKFPTDPGYFADDETGTANDRNVLWGDYFLVDGSTGSTAMFPLVSIEANPAFNADNRPGPPSRPANPSNITFYGRYTQSLGGIDHREALGQRWGARYFNNDAASTSFHVWRDTTSNTGLRTFSCEDGPDWKPISAAEVVCFSESEDAAQLCEAPGGCFPIAAQRVEVAQLGVPFTGGWCSLDLGIPQDAFAEDVDFPEQGGEIAQSYVNVSHDLGGVFSGGLPAVELESTCAASAARPHRPGLFKKPF